MADNVSITPGSGKDVTTDEASDGSHMQIVKLAYSADADKTPIGADANGLDVDVVRLPALAAGTNNIGDVDVLTVPSDPFGANADAASASGSISAKLRQIATNGIPVTDGGSSITVDGTVAVSSLPALPAGTNAIGKLAANSGVDIGDVDVTSLPSLPAGSNVIGYVTAIGEVAHDDAISTPKPVLAGGKAKTSLAALSVVSSDDATFLHADADGVLLVRPGAPLGDVLSERVTDTGGTSTAFTTFGAAGSGVRTVVTAIVAYNSSATAGTIDFRDGAAGSVLFTVPIPAGGGCVITNGGVPLFRTSTNTALAYDVSGALSTVTISISGFKSKV